MRHPIRLGLFALSLSSSIALAESGADVLMQSVGGQKGATAANTDSAAPTNWVQLGNVKLTDPFQIQFFSEWQAQKDLPYEVNQWALKVVSEDVRPAAHLISAMQTKIPQSFYMASRAAEAYMYWKLGLAQTFFDRFTNLLSQQAFHDSRLAIALEQTVSKNFDKWLTDNAIAVSSDQQATIAKMDPKRSLLYATLKGWIALRKGLEAKDILPLLPPDHAFKIPLAETAALALARNKDLAGAARVLKEHLEPAIELKKDPKLRSAYSIEIARLLYQAGSLDGAEQFYEKIPNGAPEYLKAREELTWVWLRKGNSEKLRGELATLSSPLFAKQFSPETYLVRSVSNLKFCYYDKVQADIDQFIASNGKWAKEIQTNLEATDPQPSPQSDFFSKQAKAALAKRTEEKVALGRLIEQSIEAALPAVGQQTHWVAARDQMAANEEAAKKALQAEYRRQWKNMHLTLKEAIRKMQFVKVELMSQVRTLTRTDTTTSKLEGSTLTPSMQLAKKELQEKGDMTFPFDGVVWADELFHLRSTAQARCMEARK